jgi:hypothetical protein
MNKVFQKIDTWTEPVRDWWYWNWEFVIFIIFIVGILIAVVVFALWASGAFYDEVENYDFTAQVYDKDHYTTHSTSYITSGKSRIPVYHTHHHYKIMWEDGGERGALEIGEDHYNLIKIGDFVNIHCSVRADKQGELHYYYSFKGY